MAAEPDDPRETPGHPRVATRVHGHIEAIADFDLALKSGKLHHAWLLSGPKGIGKATLSYFLAKHLLNNRRPDDALQHMTEIGTSSAAHLVNARSHPDLFVLERKVGEGKVTRLKSEISAEDARAMPTFFSQTAAMAQWRVAIVDAADDLNSESANALLKIIEEPPPRCMFFLVCCNPGKLLRTIRSRCLRVDLNFLTDDCVADVLSEDRLAITASADEKERAVGLCKGSPGRAISLLTSDAAKAFQTLLREDIRRPEGRLTVINAFAGRGPSTDDFAQFMELLLDWVAGEAAAGRSSLAQAYGDIQGLAQKTESFNLDRKLAVLESLVLVDRALKAA